MTEEKELFLRGPRGSSGLEVEQDNTFRNDDDDPSDDEDCEADRCDRRLSWRANNLSEGTGV
jgi:hypothetical protein